MSIHRAGEMAYRLKALIALRLELVLRTQLITTCNSRFRISETSGSLGIFTHMHILTHTYQMKQNRVTLPGLSSIPSQKLPHGKY